MFGYHKAKRKKKEAKKAQEALKRERQVFEADKSYYDKPEVQEQVKQQQKNEIAEKAAESKTSRDEGRKEGRAYAEEFMGRDIQGLTPKERQAIQYEANQKIHRDMQQADRKMLGEQGRRGIGPRSGVSFAQQQELQREGREAQGQVSRHVDRLDAEQRVRNRGAMFGIEQGEAAQRQLDRQMAIDELELANEKKRQRALEDQMNRLFSRL